MADMVAKLYELLGGDPPPGHEIAAWVTVDRNGPEENGYKRAGLLGGLAEAHANEKYQDLPARAEPGEAARAIRAAQKKIGIKATMLWAVNDHNLLIFGTNSVGPRRPSKLTGRVPLASVTFEGQVARRIAITVHGVPVEGGGKPADLERFAEVLRARLPG